MAQRHISNPGGHHENRHHAYQSTTHKAAHEVTSDLQHVAVERRGHGHTYGHFSTSGNCPVVGDQYNKTHKEHIAHYGSGHIFITYCCCCCCDSTVCTKKASVVDEGAPAVHLSKDEIISRALESPLITTPVCFHDNARPPDDAHPSNSAFESLDSGRSKEPVIVISSSSEPHVAYLPPAPVVTVTETSINPTRRPLSGDERDTLLDFERHASRYSECYDPHAVCRAGRSLCSDGRRAGKKVAQHFISERNGQSIFVVSDMGKLGDFAQLVHLPREFLQVRILLFAIEKTRDFRDSLWQRLLYVDEDNGADANNEGSQEEEAIGTEDDRWGVFE